MADGGESGIHTPQAISYALSPLSSYHEHTLFTPETRLCEHRATYRYAMPE